MRFPVPRSRRRAGARTSLPRDRRSVITVSEQQRRVSAAAMTESRGTNSQRRPAETQGPHSIECCSTPRNGALATPSVVSVTSAAPGLEMRGQRRRELWTSRKRHRVGTAMRMTLTRPSGLSSSLPLPGATTRAVTPKPLCVLSRTATQRSSETPSPDWSTSAGPAATARVLARGSARVPRAFAPRRHGSVTTRWMRRLELHQAGAEELDGARRHELTRRGIGPGRDRQMAAHGLAGHAIQDRHHRRNRDPRRVIRIAPTASARRARSSSGSAGLPSATITTSRPSDSSSRATARSGARFRDRSAARGKLRPSAWETPAQSAGSGEER